MIDELGKAINDCVIRIDQEMRETEDDFIFTTIRNWMGREEKLASYAISKRILSRAMWYYMHEHTEEYNSLLDECTERLKAFTEADNGKDGL